MRGSPPPGAIGDLAALDLTIATPRLVLAPIEPRHTEALHAMASNPEVPRLMSWNAHADLAQTRAWVDGMVAARERQTELAWAIERGGEAIGCISLSGLTWMFRAWRVDRAELGYWLGPRYWRHGFMTEAARAATAFAFETLGLHKVTIGCIEGNAGSQKIIETLGYRFLAILEDDVWRDGQWWDHRRYELTRTEWLARAAQA